VPNKLRSTKQFSVKRVAMLLACKLSRVFGLYSFHANCMGHENFDESKKRIVLNQVTLDVMAITKCITVYNVAPCSLVHN
jgi:hypothetical protein